MKRFFKKHWTTVSCMAGFLLFQGLIHLVIFLEESREITDETDLGTAAMGILGTYLVILLCYLFSLICSAAAFHLSTKKLKAEASRTNIVVTILSILTVLFGVVQAIVTVVRLIG